MKRYLLLALVAGLACSFSAFAGDTPETLKGVKVVDSKEAKALQEKGGVIVDTRVATEYVEEHITGCVSIPYKEGSKKEVNFDVKLDQWDVAKLPADKKTAIITYCNGAPCWKSYKAAIWAQKAGYTNVYWLRDGIPAWKKAGFPVEK